MRNRLRECALCHRSLNLVCRFDDGKFYCRSCLEVMESVWKERLRSAGFTLIPEENYGLNAWWADAHISYLTQEQEDVIWDAVERGWQLQDRHDPFSRMGHSGQAVGVSVHVEQGLPVGIVGYVYERGRQGRRKTILWKAKYHTSVTTIIPCSPDKMGV